MTKLEAEFDAAMHQACELAKEHGYVANLFRQMLAEHGGKKTAKRLLAAQAPQYGLLRLYEMGLLRISMENLVLEPKYGELILPSAKRTARERLESFGFTPGNWPEGIDV